MTSDIPAGAPTHRRLLTEDQTMERLACSRSTLWRFADELEVVKIGRARRYVEASVDRLIDNLPRVKPTAATP
jgi:predicted DNA-binding transcriptional regulator AlpA